MGCAAGLMAVIALMAPSMPPAGACTAPCRITGHATSGSTPLPGVAMTIKSGDAIKGATSTDVDGGFAFSLTAGQYTLSAELTGFGRVEQPVVVSADEVRADGGSHAVAGASSGAQRGAAGAAQLDRADDGATGRGRGQRTRRDGELPAAGADAVDRRGAADSRRSQVRQSADGAATADTQLSATETEQATRALLPPGFSTESSGDAIAINGNAGTVDRGMLQDRFGAIGRGEFDPSNTEGGFGGGLGGRGGVAPGWTGGPADAAARADSVDAADPAVRAASVDAAVQADRAASSAAAARPRQRYQGTANYTFGGSVLDAAPFQLTQRPGRPKPFTHNTYGGDDRRPGEDPRPLRRHAAHQLRPDLQRQSRRQPCSIRYATVPTIAQRNGDFSATRRRAHQSGDRPAVPQQPGPRRFQPVAQSLLQYIPQPNLRGASRTTSTTRVRRRRRATR